MVGALAGLAVIEPAAPAEDHLQLLPGRQRGKEVVALEYEATVLAAKLLALLFAHGPKIVVERQDAAGVGPQQTGERCQKRGFSAAGRPHEQSKLAGIKLDADIAQGRGHHLAGAEAFRQAPSFQRRRSRAAIIVHTQILPTVTAIAGYCNLQARRRPSVFTGVLSLYIYHLTSRQRNKFAGSTSRKLRRRQIDPELSARRHA